MKNKIIITLLFTVLYQHCVAQLPTQGCKNYFTLEVESLNYLGNFSSINFAHQLNDNLWAGATVSLMHNRAQIPDLYFKKIEHRFHGFNLGERMRYSININKKLNLKLMKYSELSYFISLSYMHTSYRNVYHNISAYDPVAYRYIYERIEISNRNMNCIDVVTGFNLKTPITGHLFLNATAGFGVIMMNGFSKADMGTSTLIRPNYLFSIGLGYAIPRKAHRKK